jgi:predicted negative regulator of RcsB-dependent stress response
MANQFDLEEQEQLDQLKHFWQQYGNLITWGLIAVLAVFSAWNFYQYWQRNQAAQAAALYDELERSLSGTDADKMQRVFGDMKERFASSSYAMQAGLRLAQVLLAQGKPEPAKAALAWVADQSSDTGYQALARLRLAGLQADTGKFDEALKTLSAPFPQGFDGLVADRKGDILSLAAKPDQAVEAYQQAYRLLDSRSEYRRLIEVKLQALGVSAAANPAKADEKTKG